MTSSLKVKNMRSGKGSNVLNDLNQQQSVLAKLSQPMIIKGKHMKGMGGANRSVKRQKRFFAQLGLPGADDLFNGTINFSTAPQKFKTVKFDYFFPEVQYKSFPRKRTEDFGFIVITRMIHRTGVFYNWGYVYVPHSSPHFGNQQMFELIGREIEGFLPGDELSIEIADGALESIH